MNLNTIIQRIANKNNEEPRFLYGKYYKKLQEKYTELKIVKGEISKLKQIQEQGYEEKLIDIIKEDHPNEFDFLAINYTPKQKIEIMQRELNFIGGSEETNDINDDIKKFTVKTLLKIPDYWWTTPASSTGKYHPDFSVEINGLVKHTKAAVKIALDLFEVEVFSFSQRNRGIVISAIILHDCLKSGLDEGYSKHDHPILITDFIEADSELLNLLNEEDFKILKGLINCHMGKFNTTKRSKIELPKPSNKLEYYVHICDYLSSRKYITFDFSGDFDV